MKAHIPMTLVYNGYTMKACIQSQFTMDMFQKAFYGQRKYFLDMRWIIIDVVYLEYDYVVHGTKSWIFYL